VLFRSAVETLGRLPVDGRPLVIVQPPLTRETAGMAARLGEGWVTGSLLYHSLDGPLGPRVTLATDQPVMWTNGLRQTPEAALVLVDAGAELEPWGFTRQALFYQTLTDVGLGHFARARLHLLRGSLLSGEQLGFLYDSDRLIVPMSRVLANKDAFIDHLAAGRRDGRTTVEIAGLQTNFFRLLSVCTGLDEATLREPGDPGERIPR
jgi:hypothetical protein